MSEHYKKAFQQSVALTAVLSVVLLVAGGVSAWTPPAQAPTAGNASPLLHTGPENQTKDGSLGVETAVVDQLCLGADCKTTWPVPDCRICVKAGVVNSGISAEQCAPFDNTVAYAGREDSSHGRGTNVYVRVICP
jgi:hypothetical protein